ncbi:MAG: glycerophosphodiester phosphodiesterase [Candidatus Latescibacteria bacterium]|jgi:glycerophosphoryl diester phosphodiesterase|nr:glycerophosphodiester phosphodiesterase [Candidatus Latescibacterota bacterium]
MNVKRQIRNPFGRRRDANSGILRPPIMRIAHRGASGKGLAPENTMAAYELALEIGVDLVEIDIHLTADGHPVVIHDRSVDRTTDGTGFIDTMTLSQVRQLDAGSWFGRAFHDERIPTLEEVLDLCRHKVPILIEAKTVESAEAAAVLVRSLRAQSHVVIQSFHGAAVRAVNRLDRRIPTAFLMSGGEAVLRRKTGVVRRVLKLGANALALKYTSANPELISMFLSRAMGFWVWTVDEEEDMRAMIDMGVGGIITNYPDRLNKVLAEH